MTPTSKLDASDSELDTPDNCRREDSTAARVQAVDDPRKTRVRPDPNLRTRSRPRTRTRPRARPQTQASQPQESPGTRNRVSLTGPRDRTRPATGPRVRTRLTGSRDRTRPSGSVSTDSERYQHQKVNEKDIVNSATICVAVMQLCCMHWFHIP